MGIDKKTDNFMSCRIAFLKRGNKNKKRIFHRYLIKSFKEFPRLLYTQLSKSYIVQLH